MRILQCVLILAFAILLKNVYRDSSNSLPNSPLNYLSSLQRAPPRAPLPPQVTSYILVAQWPPGVWSGDSGVTCQIKPVPMNLQFTVCGHNLMIATLTLELNKNWLNLESKELSIKLAAEKITPSIVKTYKLADIQAAVKKINGGLSGTIICVKRKGSSNKQQIQEIRFRYTNNFRKQNNLSPSKCGPEILFSLTEVVSVPEVHHPL
nr:hypothetical protein [Tanacetum cinerariifolium]